MEFVNKIFNEHFAPVPHDFRREKKVEELASEIVADQERLDEEREGRRRADNGNERDWSGLTNKGRTQRNEPEK